jgi:hypothetical protein
MAEKFYASRAQSLERLHAIHMVADALGEEEIDVSGVGTTLAAVRADLGVSQEVCTHGEATTKWTKEDGRNVAKTTCDYCEMQLDWDDRFGKGD